MHSNSDSQMRNKSYSSMCHIGCSLMMKRVVCAMMFLQIKKNRLNPCIWIHSVVYLTVFRTTIS